MSVDGIIFVDDCKCRWMSSVDLTLLLCYLRNNFSLATRVPKISENYNGNICRVYILSSYIPTTIKYLNWTLSRMIFLVSKRVSRFWNTGLVSSGASLTSWEEGASLALVGHPSSDGVTIKIPYGVDVLHRPASHPNFSYWVG